ncbi:hypothetical protein KKC88_06335 [Patescibacteria group bacterium]|nr:hypothetical protein [Patescibacteria group bacterium]MBU1673900.1 hypothetical protein [Patescibacteria group bacterium]MBU1963427.1 hypothetical protein [Patescibacteria group bacterium]
MKQKVKKSLTAFSLVAAVAAVGVVGLMTATAATKAAGPGISSVWDKLTDEQKQEVQAEMGQHREEMQAQKDEMENALTDGDYAKWKEIIDSRPQITDYVNEGNFDRFAEMHKLMQEGDFDGAQEIREELGLPDGMGMGHGPGMGKGMGKGFMK